MVRDAGLGASQCLMITSQSAFLPVLQMEHWWGCAQCKHGQGRKALEVHTSIKP